MRCGFETIDATVFGEYEGETGLRAAVLYACGANEDHGRPRTIKDKRRAVLKLLEDPDWSTKSSRWIANVYARVSKPLRREAPAT